MRRRVKALLAALIGAQIAYSRLPEERLVPATRGIVALLLTTSLVEARDRRPVLAAGAIGFATEIIGERTGKPFGRYAYSDKLGPQVLGLPAAVFAAWAMMARPAWVAAGWISSRPPARVPLAAAALTAWDVFLDPRMAREGYWSWPGGGRYEGIPASNFLGWFGTGLGVYGVYAALDRSEPTSEDDGALALYAWTWIGEAFANAVLWHRPRVAAAGALAMGAIAVPALRRRLGR